MTQFFARLQGCMAARIWQEWLEFNFFMAKSPKKAYAHIWGKWQKKKQKKQNQNLKALVAAKGYSRLKK